MKKNDFNDLLASVKEAGQIKKKYDFSKGERGKFFKANASLNIPVTLPHSRTSDTIGAQQSVDARQASQP